MSYSRDVDEWLAAMKVLWDEDRTNFPRQRVQGLLGKAYAAGREETLARLGDAVIEGRVFGEPPKKQP